MSHLLFKKFLIGVLNNLLRSNAYLFIMSWETIWEDIWVCPKCGKKTSIRFRMDDFSRREYDYTEEGGLSKDSSTNPSPAFCSKCGIEMVKTESK